MAPTTFSIFSGFACGALLINALLLFLLHVPLHSEWRSFRSARMCVTIACLLLAIVYGADAISEHHSGQIEQIAWYGVSSLQAILFTSTCVVFVAPNRRLRNIIVTHLAITVAVLLISVALYVQQQGEDGMPTALVSLPVYALQIAYFVVFFHRAYSSGLRHLEDVYDDELAGRLFWVKRLFYVALSVGLIASVGMVSFGYLYATCFEGSVIVVYSMIVCSFMNYHSNALFVVKASKAMPEQKHDATEGGVEAADTLSAQDADEVQRHLDAWVECRGFVKADLSVDEIVQELGVSRDSFNAYFKYRLGTQFRSWRRELRLREAMRLLRDNPSLPVPDLMEAVGYNDRSNFHKDFQRFTGHSLNEFRYQYR